jgi:hypothetical protein
MSFVMRFCILIIFVLPLSAKSGVLDRFTVKGKVYEFDSQTITLISSPRAAWRVRRSLINPKVNLRPGQILIVEGTHKDIQAVRVPKD